MIPQKAYAVKDKKYRLKFLADLFSQVGSFFISHAIFFLLRSLSLTALGFL